MNDIMNLAVRPGNLSVATCISSAIVSTITLLISTHLALALFARAFPNRFRQYVSHESAIRSLERRFRLLFYASILLIVDSLNHIFYFGSLWLLHEADPLVYRVIYVATSSTTNPLIVFAIVHRCIFIVGQHCARRRWRLLAIAFMLCFGVSLAIGISGGEIIAALLAAGPRSEHAELWSTSPYVSSEVSMIVIILPLLVFGASVWALAYLVRTSKTTTTQTQGELPPAPRISVSGMAASSTASFFPGPSQNTLSDSGNHLNSTTFNVQTQTSVCTTVLPSLDAVDVHGRESQSRSADILSSNTLASQLSKMAKRATGSSINLKSHSPTTFDSVGPMCPPSAAPSSQHTPVSHTAPSQQLAYPLSRSFLILTLLLTLSWIGVLGISAQGPFIGPIRSATLMSLLGILGCWADASFESLARVAAKRQNEQSWETVSAHFSFFSTIRQTLGRAMGGGSRRASEQAGARRMSNQVAVGTMRQAASPTVLRSAPTCLRADGTIVSNARQGQGEGHQVKLPSLVQGSSPRSGLHLQQQQQQHQSRKGSGQPQVIAEESSRRSSVEVVTVPRKGK